jgi:para-nitrobenzyl esterase
MKTLEMAEKDGVKYAEGLGASSLAELRAMDASAFARQMVVTGGAWPIVDGYVMPDDQYRMYENGDFNDVNVLIGYNSDEGASFGSGNDPAVHVAGVEERYGPYAERLLSVYPLGEGPGVPKSARDLMRDAAFGWHTWSWARLQSEKGKSKVFLYYFDQHPDYPEGSPQYGNGSPHGQEVDFVFKSLRRETVPTDFALSETMATYWTNFAKYGDPNGEGLPEWPEFTPDNHVTMVLTGSGPHPAAVPDEDAMWVLNEYFAWRRSPEGAAWAAAQP